MAGTRKIRNLNDLAERFGCTATTVSMALKNSPQLSSELREKIQAAATAGNFRPRNYTRRPPQPRKSAKRYAHLGPVLVLHNERFREPNPARDLTMPDVFRLFAEYGVEYTYADIDEVIAHPELMNDYTGVLYYNDQAIDFPPHLAVMQIFGWDAIRPGQDRITVDDAKIARIAVDTLCHADVRRVALIWRDDMIAEGLQHPRLTVQKEEFAKRGIAVEELVFSRQDSDFTKRLGDYIQAGDKAVGFFAFNAVSGLKLCSALESLSLLHAYSPDRVVVCDDSALMENFWPCPQIVDLNFAMLAKRAVDGLLWRLENPGAPSSITLQSPQLWHHQP